MKLSYFSYDFWECCCEAMKPGVCMGRFLWAGLLCVPVGGGTTTPLIPVPTPNFARNSPTTTSNIEFRSLELQRFQPLLKLLPIELRASFRRQRRATTHRHRSQAHWSRSQATLQPHKPHIQPGPTTPLIPVPTPNFARNSPTTTSNIEFRSLELQRFQPLLKLLPIELRASFRRQRRATTHRHRSGAHLHAAVRPRKREKILPARAKHPKISTFSPAGRILSRSDL